VVGALHGEQDADMRNDADFAAYLAARWPFLVRSLVLLGCSDEEAQEAARAGLARCYAAWDRVRRADDVDAYVYRTVLERWHRSRRRHRRSAPQPDEAPAPAPPEGEVTDRVLLRRALQAQLDRLGEEEREVLVLRFVAELTEPQVAEVLDVPVGAVTSRVFRALGLVDLAALREMTDRWSRS
jgi:RNA polymerase sigma factor (sigma-70 family)